MATVNVRRDVTDPFYRYKMERIQTKIEGKGNGIKTVVVNLPSVAQSLARPGAYVIKFFGFELGAQTNVDPKDDRWIINGSHDSAKLQDHLDGFINKFVLCKKCKNPETEVNIKDGAIILDCKACGQRTDADLRHKLSGFILKTQPKKGKKDKAERKAARKAKQNGTGKDGSGSGGEDGSDNGSEENVENGDDAEPESDDELKKLRAEAAVVDNDAGPAEVEWATPQDRAAVDARLASLPDEFKQKANVESGGKGYKQLDKWIEKQVEAKGSIDNVKSRDIYKKARELGIEKKAKTMQALVQIVFDAKILTQVENRDKLFGKIYKPEPGLSDEEKAARKKRLQRAILGGTERLIESLAEENPKIYAETPKILQQYWVNELLKDKNVVASWGAKPSDKFAELENSKKIRKEGQAFFTALDKLPEADEDEEYDSGDSTDLDFTEAESDEESEEESDEDSD